VKRYLVAMAMLAVLAVLAAVAAGGLASFPWNFG
jgi:hypothetical protein